MKPDICVMSLADIYHRLTMYPNDLNSGVKVDTGF